MTQEDCTL